MRARFSQIAICCAVLGVSLAGCGTYVPGIQEPPLDSTAGQTLSQQIVTNVKCEVQDAINDVYKDYPRTFLDTWGVQVTLNLATGEKSTANPNLNWLPISPANAVFNLGATATLSSEALRTNKVNFFYTVQELRALEACDPRNRPGGPMLMQKDLKLDEWLYDNLSFSATGSGRFSRNTPSGPFKQNVFSHEVKFEVVTSGGISPGLKLTRFAINPAGTVLAASRTRTHTMTITFGPTEVIEIRKLIAGRPKLIATVSPSLAAVNSHLSSEIGVAVANGIRSALQP